MGSSSCVITNPFDKQPRELNDLDQTRASTVCFRKYIGCIARIEAVGDKFKLKLLTEEMSLTVKR